MCFRYFCQDNPLFYHLNLIPCHYWSWRRNIYFLVNNFVRHTFSMSKSSIRTKTVLTMTDMTESTELLAFKRQKDGYKVTVKISLCICVVLSWDELKFRCQSGFGPPADLNGGGGVPNPDYQHQTWRHMCKSVEFVVDSRPDSEGFSPAPLVFLPSQKPTL